MTPAQTHALTRWPGRLMMKLRDADCCEAPAHLDIVAGVTPPALSIDLGGRIDRTIKRRVTAMEVRCPYHAADCVHQPGHRHSHYSQLEYDLGLTRTRAVTLAEPEQTDAVIAALRDLDQVEWVTSETLSLAPLHAQVENNIVTREMIMAPHLQVGVPEALAMVAPDERLRVAVIDTGVALGHRELSGRLDAGFDTVDLAAFPMSQEIRLVGDSSGRDFDAMDLTGHGSHVAGILGARGLHLPRGAAGAARIIPVRALAAASAGHGRVFGVGGLLDIDCGIKVACDLGANVMNMSFGTPADAIDSNAPPPHRDVMRYAMAKGAIAVAAMGNSGALEDYYPAALPEVIAVGSVNEANRPSEFSTRGTHVDIAAPGERIISLGLEGYKESTGTSHATPFVAGAVALMAARARQAGQPLTFDLARRALRDGASAKPPHAPDPAIGYGVLNIPAALRRLDQLMANPER